MLPGWEVVGVGVVVVVIRAVVVVVPKIINNNHKILWLILLGLSAYSLHHGKDPRESLFESF